MCKPQGPRCSTYSKNTLDIVDRRHVKAVDALGAYEEKYSETLAKEEDLTKSDLIRHHKHQRLQEELEEATSKLDQARFDYQASPLGQEELAEQITQATEEKNDEEVTRLTQILEAARNHHNGQNKDGRELRELEKVEGLDSAKEEAEKRAAEAAEARAEAAKNLEEKKAARKKLEKELKSSDKEIAALEERIKEAEKDIKELTEEEKAEEAEKLVELERARRKKRRLMVAIGAAVSAVLLFQLVMWASTGKQSQMLNYAKSAVTRRAIGLAQSHFMGRNSD